ncbi:MAG: hypothetical protein AUI10_00365 [Actinobacteria bacterium 13_2_20CM_2_72_6]|nr:MAG: hypothetical protein AUI10_00365 [Actinobacteria bacterium 13_2_20CM_2_72_6]
MMIVGNVCEPSADNPEGLCYAWLPAGGWPFAFLYDDPGTSVRGQLGLEDDFRPGWFLVDAAIFGTLPAIGAVVRHFRRRRPSELTTSRNPAGRPA